MPATIVEDLDVDEGIYYPSSDGKPMAESPEHARCMVFLYQALEDHFRDSPGMYIALDMNWYWEKGNRKACRAPDVMVIPKVIQKRRRSFRSWNEGGVIPTVCFELASKRTWKKDLGEAKDDYEEQGVKEYFIFDPEFLFLETPLLGFRLKGKRYERIPTESDGSLISRQLGLRVICDKELLRLIDPKTGEYVPLKDERTESERREKERERRRADGLEAEVKRLRRLLDQMGHSTNGAH